MILVVFSHILLFSYNYNGDAFSYNDIFVKFRMPLFFFISGWVLYKADRIWNFDYTKFFLKNKFRVQIVSTTVFFLLYAYVFNYNILEGLMVSKLGYWFTFDLFCFFCFYTLSILTIPKKISGGVADLVIVLIMIIVMVLSFSHNVFDKSEIGRAIFRYLSIEKWRYYVFFIMGTFVKKYFNCFVSLTNKKYITSNPQPIGFSGILLAKRQNSFYCTYFLHNRNVADTKSPYPIKRLEVIRWFNQKSMVFNQSLS